MDARIASTNLRSSRWPAMIVDRHGCNENLRGGTPVGSRERPDAKEECVSIKMTDRDRIKTWLATMPLRHGLLSA